MLAYDRQMDSFATRCGIESVCEGQGKKGGSLDRTEHTHTLTHTHTPRGSQPSLYLTCERNLSQKSVPARYWIHLISEKKSKYVMEKTDKKIRQLQARKIQDHRFCNIFNSSKHILQDNNFVSEVLYLFSKFRLFLTYVVCVLECALVTSVIHKK